MVRKEVKEKFLTLLVTPQTFTTLGKLSEEEDISRSELIRRFINNGISKIMDIRELEIAIKDSKSVFGLNIPELVKKLKNIENLNFYRKAYLSHSLKDTPNKRIKLFELMEWSKELEESHLIDGILEESKNKGQKKPYSLLKFANNLRINLSSFGEEYLKNLIGEKDLEMIKELRSDKFPPIQTEEPEETEQTEIKKYLVEEGIEEIIKEPYEELEKTEEEEEEEEGEWEVEPKE